MAVRILASLALFVLFSQCASAQFPTEFGTVLTKKVSNEAGGAELSGMETTDILINFNGQYTGSQMLLTLDSGEIYQDAVGGDTPPDSAFFGVFPSLAFDSFFASGSATVGGPFGEPLLVGRAVNLGGDDPSLADAPINQTWAAAPGASILDQQEFLVSRVTLSPDAIGTLQFTASVDGALATPITIPILNGCIGAFCIPEPSSLALLSIVALGSVIMRLVRARTRQSQT